METRESSLFLQLYRTAAARRFARSRYARALRRRASRRPHPAIPIVPNSNDGGAGVNTHVESGSGLPSLSDRRAVQPAGGSAEAIEAIARNTSMSFIAGRVEPFPSRNSGLDAMPRPCAYERDRGRIQPVPERPAGATMGPAKRTPWHAVAVDRPRRAAPNRTGSAALRSTSRSSRKTQGRISCMAE